MQRISRLCVHSGRNFGNPGSTCSTAAGRSYGGCPSFYSRIGALIARHHVRWIKVKGHNYHAEDERVAGGNAPLQLLVITVTALDLHRPVVH
jgi:hypothetical protein